MEHSLFTVSLLPNYGARALRTEGKVRFTGEGERELWTLGLLVEMKVGEE